MCQRWKRLRRKERGRERERGEWGRESEAMVCVEGRGEEEEDRIQSEKIKGNIVFLCIT